MVEVHGASFVGNTVTLMPFWIVSLKFNDIFHKISDGGMSHNFGCMEELRDDRGVF